MSENDQIRRSALKHRAHRAHRVLRAQRALLLNETIVGYNIQKMVGAPTRRALHGLEATACENRG